MGEKHLLYLLLLREKSFYMVRELWGGGALENPVGLCKRRDNNP